MNEDNHNHDHHASSAGRNLKQCYYGHYGHI